MKAWARRLFGLAIVCRTFALAQAPAFSPLHDSLPSPTPIGLATDIQDEVEQLDDGSLDEENVEAGDLERIAEVRGYYLRRPLDLNSASYDQLADLGLLSPAQINDILRHRQQTGDFLTAEELQSVDLLTIGEVRRLLPYVAVRQNPRSALRSLGARWRDAASFAALRSGYQSTSANRENWLGPGLPIYLRLRRTAGRQFSVGCVLEQDAGEPWGGSGKPAGFDYVSGHVFADELPGPIKTVAIGDFGVNWGQGLINYSGFASGKGAFVMQVQRNARWLQPHASVTEVGFFRGAATQVAVGPLRAMLLASRTRLDGALDTLDALSPEPLFASNRLSGLHRTVTELAGRGSNSATSFGGALGLERPWGRVSAHYLRHEFAVPFAPSERLYQQFNFAGSTMQNASLAWQTFLGSVSWFGETAIDGGGHVAAVTGLQTSLDRRIDISVVYRRYDAGYRALYANAFGNSRRPDTEEGLHIGSRVQLASAWTLQCFADVFRRPFARFRASRPGVGQDGLARLTYDVRRRHSLYAQIRHRRTERDEPADDSEIVRTLRPYNRTSARLQGEVRVSESLTLRARVEYARTEESGQIADGTLVYQDILWKPERSNLSLTARIALVDTDDFDARIYAFENDLLYRFRIPAYYGRGTRSYLNIRWRGSSNLTVEVRGALGRYRARAAQSELTGQLRWQF